MRPLVSVIIPTHNRAKLLREALHSVLTQEGAGKQFDVEVIVIDDASTDNTAEVARQHLEVQYVRLERNYGPSRARNVGLKSARGKYAAFLDDDDLWLPYKLCRQVPVLEANPEVDVVYGQLIVWSGDQTLVWPDARLAPSGSVFRALLKELFIGTHSVLIRRKAFEEAGYFDESLRCWEDYDMWLRLAFRSRFKFLSGPVGLYRLTALGSYLTAAVERSERDLRHVIERGLAMLPNASDHVAQLAQQARAGSVFRIADQLNWRNLGQEQMAYLIGALSVSPWMAKDSWARLQIANRVCHVALDSRSPTAVGRSFCAEVKTSIVSRQLWLRYGVRRLCAEVWTQMAIRLQWGSWEELRAARFAALHAVLEDPFRIRRLMIWKILGRSVFARFGPTSPLV